MAGDSDLLVELRATVLTAAPDYGLTPEQATALAMRLCTRLRAHFGGSYHYVCSIDRQGRDEQIRGMVASGETITGAAKKAGVSVKTARRAVRDRRALGPEGWGF